MPDRVEPPILLSRITTFVFAVAVVTVIVLIVTLSNMFPLVRPQVFFLLTHPQTDVQVSIAEPPVHSTETDFLDQYKRSFVREYIKARNEVSTNIATVRKTWGTGADGLVYAWSSPEVYNEFTQTNMWNALMNDVPDFVFECPVEFLQTGAVIQRNNDKYEVNFRYFCKNSGGQIATKDYKIVLTVKQDTGPSKWLERLNNPLGLRVTGYTIESGNGDPLDTGYLADGEETAEEYKELL